jgi:hypothetical protein
MRLVLKTTKGRKMSAAAPAALSSAPSGSRRGFPVDLHPLVELLQGRAIEALHQRLHDLCDLRMGPQHRLADDRNGRIDRLVMPVILQHHKVGGGDAPVGAVHHGSIDLVGAGRGRADGRGSFPARQHDQLIRAQGEAIGLFQRAQGARVGKLG